jgi:hypothetical protein
MDVDFESESVMCVVITYKRTEPGHGDIEITMDADFPPNVLYEVCQKLVEQEGTIVEMLEGDLEGDVDLMADTYDFDDPARPRFFGG